MHDTQSNNMKYTLHGTQWFINVFTSVSHYICNYGVTDLINYVSNYMT